MSFQPIENYGLIGNLDTAALVGIDSSIDFFCFPDFDSPTVFAALLDPEKGGSFRIETLDADTECKQMYISESNILNTRLLSLKSAAQLMDFMPVQNADQKNQLVRNLEVIHGQVTFRLCCQPAFDYGRCSHTVEIDGNVARFIPADSNFPTLVLRATTALERQDNSVVSTFTLQETQKAAFLLGAWNENQEDGRAANLQQQVDGLYRQTLEYWRQWIGKCTYTGRWREQVRRSVLALKLMTSRRHGSVIAAPTFALPEQIGGERNWDYRFTWIRDAAFTLSAFMKVGLRKEAEDFFNWLNRQLEHSHRPDRPMQIMYGLDGSTELPEQELTHLRGYRDSRPVRIGNGAFDQLQLDIYGELFDAIYLYSKYGHMPTHDNWVHMKSMLTWLGNNWNQPDEGIWEVRGGTYHFLHSRLMSWVAFDRAIRMAQHRSLSAPLEEWYKHRDAITEDIHRNFWNEKVGAFTQHSRTEALDAAVLLMPLVRFISPVDPRWLSTLQAIEKSLAEDALVYRYRHTESADGLAGEEGSFTCCSFWFVECLVHAGEVEKARQNFEKLLAHANHLGLFSEEIGRNGHQLGNFPQALSHLALISAALALDKAVSGTRAPAWSL